MQGLIAAILTVLVIPVAQGADKECPAPLSHEVRKLRSWYFNKYLVHRDGNLVRRFDSSVDPMSAQLRKAVESVL